MSTEHDDKAEKLTSRDRAEEIRRLRDACAAVLLFHSAGPWDSAKGVHWWNLTQDTEVTTRVLCDTVRAALSLAAEGGAA